MKSLVVIPVKRFEDAKSRLSKVLKPIDRIKLVQLMLLDVLTAVEKAKTEFDVAIVTQDTDKVLEILEEVQLSKPLWLLEDKNNTLSKSIKYVAQGAVRTFYSTLLVIPDDLPLIQPKDIDAILNKTKRFPECIAIAPSRSGGTNLLLLKPPDIIEPCYGPNSFKKHKLQALSKKIPVVEYISDTTDLDIDNIDDLLTFLHRKRRKREAYKFLEQYASSL